MLLVRALEEQGQILFKYRGYFPVLLFLLVIPFMGVREEVVVQGTARKLLFALALLVTLSGILVRALTIGQTPKGTSGRNTKAQKADVLNTTGVYSLVRHPLYVGNFLIWAGIGIFTYEVVYLLLLILIFWLYYERILYAEERFLEGKFGNELSDWAADVPAFIPRLKGYRPSDHPFSLKKVLRKEYSGFMATIIGFVYVAFLRDIFQDPPFRWDPDLALVLAFGAIVTVTLRSLHHYSSLLKE